MKKKILIFSLDYLPGTISGAEAAIQEITNRIAPDEIEFHMVTLYYDAHTPRVEQIGNVLIHRVGLFRRPNASLVERRSFPLHYNKHYFQFMAGIKGWLLHRKYQYDGAWAMMAHGTGVPVSIFNILTGVPYALTLQEGDPPEYIEKTMRPLWPLFKRAFTHAQILQSISTFLADWARKMEYRGNLALIANGANPESLYPTFEMSEVTKLKQELGKKDGEVYLVNTARLVKQKGFDTTIRALILLPAHIKLLVVGDGPERENLELLATELGLKERVLFTGQIDRAEVTKYRLAGDIFVGPSRSEGLGNAFLSAMACGLPVIATQVGGIADFLFDSKNNKDIPTTGFAIPVENPEAIARQVLYILEHQVEVAVVTARARKMVEEKYDWNKIAMSMEHEVFEKLWIS